jgi:hypothetical protein
MLWTKQRVTARHPTRGPADPPPPPRQLRSARRDRRCAAKSSGSVMNRGGHFMFFRWTLPESEKEQKNKTARRCVDASMRCVYYSHV